jgi:Tfp pilus assembly protein PilN
MIRINLLKEEPTGPVIAEKEEVIKEKKPFPMTSLIGLFIVAAIALGFLQFNAIKKEKTLLTAVQDEKEKLKDVLVKLERVQEQQDLIVRKIILINQLKSQQGVAVSILDELSKNIPYWVWLTEVSFSKQQVQIRGRAIDNNLIADYIYNLETSPHFRDVRLASSNRRQARGNEFLDFALTARYLVIQPPQPVTKIGQKGAN